MLKNFPTSGFGCAVTITEMVNDEIRQGRWSKSKGLNLHYKNRLNLQFSKYTFHEHLNSKNALFDILKIVSIQKT